MRYIRPVLMHAEDDLEMRSHAQQFQMVKVVVSAKRCSSESRPSYLPRQTGWPSGRDGTLLFCFEDTVQFLKDTGDVDIMDRDFICCDLQSTKNPRTISRRTALSHKERLSVSIKERILIEQGLILGPRWPLGTNVQ